MSNVAQSKSRHKPGTCFHCGRIKKIAGRGLCWACYTKNREIRLSYPLIMENRAAWTERQLEQIFYLRTTRIGTREIARRVGRSYYSVKEALKNHVDKSVPLIEVVENTKIAN